jgi:hypothetical protein
VSRAATKKRHRPRSSSAPLEPPPAIVSPTGVYVRVPLTQSQIETLGEAWSIVRDVIQTARRAEHVLAKRR